MIRFVLDTGIAGLYLDRKRGVFERAEAEVIKGNRVGIAAPVLAELVYRAEGSPKRERNLQRLRQALRVWKLWLPDSDTAFEYGRIAFELKQMAGRLARTIFGLPPSPTQLKMLRSSRWIQTSPPYPA